MMNAYPRWSLLALPLLAGVGCSDPVPPPAQAAITLEIGQPVSPVSGRNCPTIKTYSVGAYDSKTMMYLSPSATDHGQSVISGENQSSISCSVSGGGGNFKFSGSIVAPSSGGPVTVSFSNGVISNGTGTADINIYTPPPGLGANFSNVGLSPAMPCTFTVVNGQIKGGSMWASFACPDIEAPPSGACGGAASPECRRARELLGILSRSG